MQKAPAAKALKLDGKIQSGMNAPIRRTKMLHHREISVLKAGDEDVHDC